MTTKGIALVVKEAAAAAGYLPEAFSGRSLSGGLLTGLRRQNTNLLKLREHSRHALIDIVADYVRATERYRDRTGKGFMCRCT